MRKTSQIMDSTLVGESRFDNRFLACIFLGKLGARSAEMPYQAELLIDQIKNGRVCDWTVDWKVLTVFAGVS
jgi:hypothetical protein